MDVSRYVRFFEEVIFLKRDSLSILQQLKTLRPLECAYFVSFLEFETSEEVENIIDSLVSHFKVLNRHPCFPYPFILVKETNPKQFFFPECPTVKDLPSYYNVFSRKINTQEMQLLKKQELLQKKIKIVPFEQQLIENQTLFKKRKELQQHLDYYFFLQKLSYEKTDI